MVVPDERNRWPEDRRRWQSLCRCETDNGDERRNNLVIGPDDSSLLPANDVHVLPNG